MQTLERERLRILIIEDDASLRSVLRRHLGVFNEVREASTCEEARNMLLDISSRPPHVVLLDKNLPDGEGGSLIGPILNACPETAIMVMTGDSSYNDVLNALELGAHDFLTKSEYLIEEITLRIPIARAHAKQSSKQTLALDELSKYLPSMQNPPSKSLYESYMNVSEKIFLQLAIRLNKGHLGEAANSIGLARSTMWKKMSELGVRDSL